ncbi:hypothetical protein HYALB_00000185 [Hymenoscyphus albidus]|uniref:Uncharacterized protein n=1 Tax=Hymenoscyphus albidus TaxID=595503 RepID=A0A9N9LX20_9HELO|nr:hypothetical protein HYALB_00000185 [Hymenoscyphus albidus]
MKLPLALTLLSIFAAASAATPKKTCNNKSEACENPGDLPCCGNMKCIRPIAVGVTNSANGKQCH